MKKRHYHHTMSSGSSSEEAAATAQQQAQAAEQAQTIRNVLQLVEWPRWNLVTFLREPSVVRRVTDCSRANTQRLLLKYNIQRQLETTMDVE